RGQQALVDVERFLDHVAQRRLMSLPAEGTNYQVAVDAFDGTVVERAVGAGGNAAERDTLRRQQLLDAMAVRLGARGGGCRLGVQICAHLARQRRHRPETQDMRSIALVGTTGALAVAAQEGILRLRAGAVRAAL